MVEAGDMDELRSHAVVDHEFLPELRRDEIGFDAILDVGPMGEEGRRSCSRTRAVYSRR